MFKNLIIYRIAPLAQPLALGQVEQGLAQAPFMECGPTQEKSTGWTPPRGEEHGALVESIGGQWIMRFITEVRRVPGAALARAVEEKAAHVEQETGRNPGKKERRELKDTALLELLPHAFPARAAMWVWIDPRAGLLVLDTPSQARADEAVSQLVELLPGLSVALLYTVDDPQAAMACWLADQAPPRHFTVDRECELKSTGEEKAVVRYARHPLDIAEVQAHIAAGKLPTKLALTWADRVSFVLTERLQVRKLEFLGAALEGKQADDGGFDADVAIATGELARLIADLVGALGGEDAQIGGAE